MRPWPGWWSGALPLSAFLTGCGEPPQELPGSSWQWISFSGRGESFQVDQPSQYLLTFGSDGTLQLKADCNQAGGEYSVDGEGLGLRVGPATMALCPPDSRSEQFLALLAGATGYEMDGELLTVDLEDGSEMLFSPAEDGGPGLDPQAPESGGENDELQISGLLGPWEWVLFQGMDDTSLEIDDPSRYTLEFTAEGILVLADCNRGRGGFDLQSSSLRFTEIVTTRMACPAESMADLYLNHLEYVRGWVMEDGHLYLSLMADGGIMEFRPAGEAG